MKIRGHPNALLSQGQLEELRSRLINKRQELADSIESLSALMQAKKDCDIHDAGDAASLQESRHRASIIADQQKTTIAEIDAALGRLQKPIWCQGVIRRGDYLRSLAPDSPGQDGF